MTPAEMTHRLRRLHAEGDEIVARFTEKTPETVEVLRQVKPGILTLHQAAERARCAEPLHVLVREFRHDLEQMAAGVWPVETIARAITIIGPGYGWQFTAEAA